MKKKVSLPLTHGLSFRRGPELASREESYISISRAINDPLCEDGHPARLALGNDALLTKYMVK